MNCSRCGGRDTVPWFSKARKAFDVTTAESGLGVVAALFFGIKDAVLGKAAFLKCGQCGQVFQARRSDGDPAK